MPFVDLPLGDAELFYDTVYDGTHIGDASAWSDFSWPSMVTDPTTYYRIELDITVDPGLASYDGIAAYSLNDVGDPDSSGWASLDFKDNLPEGASTIALTFGPGRDQWDDRVTEGESRVLIDMPAGVYVTGARWSEVAVSGYSGWLDAAPNPEQLVSTTTSASGSPWAAPSGKRWGWQSWSNDEGDPASEAATAWHLEGNLDPTSELFGFGRIPLSGGVDGMRWNVTWLTVDSPATVPAAPGFPETDPFADPQVLGIEWADDAIPLAFRAEVYPSGEHGWTFAYGRSMPVKYADGVGDRYEPDPETAGAMNARPTVATSGYASGGGIVKGSFAPAASPGSSFAVSLVDP